MYSRRGPCPFNDDVLSFDSQILLRQSENRRGVHVVNYKHNVLFPTLIVRLRAATVRAVLVLAYSSHGTRSLHFVRAACGEIPPSSLSRSHSEIRMERRKRGRTTRHSYRGHSPSLPPSPPVYACTLPTIVVQVPWLHLTPVETI